MQQFEIDKTAGFEPEISRMFDWGRDLGVSMEIEIDRNLLITDFGRDLSKPATKGNGRLFLAKFLELTDLHGVNVETSYVTDEAGLLTYYESFGFVVDDIEPGPVTNLLRTSR